MLTVQNLGVSINNHPIVENISFEVQENDWLMIIGPNGAGKSTLLNAVAKAIPHTGVVTCMGQNTANIKPTQLARLIGVLGQKNTAAYSFTVGEVVRMGRYAYSGGIFAQPDEDGEKHIQEALLATGMQELENRSILTLSGGELQRTFLAQVFAQNPHILLLDEPANHLDIGYQSQIFKLINQWAKKPLRAVVSVVHDLSLAKKYGTKMLLMHKGKAAAFGSPQNAMEKDTLKKVYGIDVYAWMNEMLGCWME